MPQISIESRLAERCLARSKRRKKPPTYREFSGTVRLPSGPLKGHCYDPDSDPCQSYLIDQIDSGKWERVYVTAPPQYGGKSLVCILVPLLRNAIALRLPVGYGLPTLQDLDKSWSEKLRPILLESGYKAHLPSSGPGARGGRGHTLQFTDPETGEAEGMIVFLAGGAYGSTVATAIVDEIDQFRNADGTPLWTFLEDIFNRANSYGRKALRIGVGTVESDDQSIILPLVLTHGTGTRPWLQCPTCNRYQRITWDQVRYDDTDEFTARESARIACIHCAAAWTEDGRKKAVRAAKFCHKGQTIDDSGNIVGDAPKTTSFGLIWTALDSSLTDLREICVEHLRAKIQRDGLIAEHGLMRKFYRYRLCEPYDGDKLNDDSTPNRLTRRYILARSEGSKYGPLEGGTVEDGDSTHHSATCPSQVDGLVMALDVQRGGLRAPGRIYYLMMGVASDFRTYDLAWGANIISPIGAQATEPEIHAGLDRLEVLRGTLAEKYGRTVVRQGVDVGDRQDEIRRWLVRHHDWWPVKGLPLTMKAVGEWDLQDWIYRRLQEEGKWNLYFVASGIVRRQAQGQFLVQPEKPGAAHLPKGILPRDSIHKHYCGTAEIPDGRGGTRWSERESDIPHHPEWQRRIDLLDCRTYALAMAYQWHRSLTIRKPPKRKFGTLGNTNAKPLGF